MARPRSMLNRIADGLLKVFADHAEQNAGDWFLAPNTFRRGVSEEIQGQADPIIAVTLNGSVEPVDLRPLGYQTSRANLLVVYAAGRSLGGLNADEAAAEMVSDLWRVLAGNRQLAAVNDPEAGVDDPDQLTLLQGFLSIGTASISANSSPTQGEVVIEQQVTVQWTWSATAP